ncbi:hypothetical protein DMA11_24260 [Marinilabiliaceae bacterium JC017]|nr:hypothetical protein DMA11_24260 [Marinilabiliaceae bacterium JC017]
MVPGVPSTKKHRAPNVSPPTFGMREENGEVYGYLRQGTTGAKETANRSHSSLIVPLVVGEVPSEPSNVGKGSYLLNLVCLFFMVKCRYMFKTHQETKCV